jgi:hypothetical protein
VILPGASFFPPPETQGIPPSLRYPLEIYRRYLADTGTTAANPSSAQYGGPVRGRVGKQLVSKVAGEDEKEHEVYRRNNMRFGFAWLAVP